jgi:hypothetical protein
VKVTGGWIKSHNEGSFIICTLKKYQYGDKIKKNKMGIGEASGAEPSGLCYQIVVIVGNAQVHSLSQSVFYTANRY